jgi:hypothetical protein
VKRSLGDVENLYQDLVKVSKWLLLLIVLDQVLLILRGRSGISNPWSQGGTKEAVKCVKLGQEVKNLQWVSLGTRSIHKVYLILLENPVSVDPSLRLHSQLVLEAKQVGKLLHCDLILPPVCHPH